MIRLTLHVYMHDDRNDAVEVKLDQLITAVAGLKAQGAKVMKELDDLTAEVARNTTVDESAVVLLEGLAAKIEALKNDPAALQALANSMKSSTDSLAAAIVRNTPAEEPPA